MAKYDSLREHLDGLPSAAVAISFETIGDLVPGGLPASAYKHREWWGNQVDGQHVQARAWLDGGRTVLRVDLETQTVRFSARA